LSESGYDDGNVCILDERASLKYGKRRNGDVLDGCVEHITVYHTMKMRDDGVAVEYH
jgi:hypothetical protein